MPGLKVVGDDRVWETPGKLLILAGKDRLRVTLEERDTPVPLISLLLHEHYTLDQLIDAGERLGVQMAARLPYIWADRRHVMRGAVVPLLGGPLVAVPFGFFQAGPH
jgi:hypothetical protein